MLALADRVDEVVRKLAEMPGADHRIAPPTAVRPAIEGSTRRGLGHAGELVAE